MKAPGMFNGRAYCVRSRHATTAMSQSDCLNEACDRFATAGLVDQARKMKTPIGWADLKTERCGFVPREGR